jgi:hypothetical protein
LESLHISGQQFKKLTPNKISSESTGNNQWFQEETGLHTLGRLKRIHGYETMYASGVGGRTFFGFMELTPANM